MNKADLKKLIKPLVKECVQETLLEEGFLVAGTGLEPATFGL